MLAEVDAIALDSMLCDRCDVARKVAVSGIGSRDALFDVSLDLTIHDGFLSFGWNTREVMLAHDLTQQFDEGVAAIGREVREEVRVVLVCQRPRAPPKAQSARKS